MFGENKFNQTLMEICFLHHTYPGIGGTETVTNLLASCFIEKGIRVSVIAWQKPHSYNPDSLDTVYLPDSKSLNSDENNAFISSYIEKRNIDCLINQGPFWIPPKDIKLSKTIIISVLHYAPGFKIANQKNEIKIKFAQSSRSIAEKIKKTIRYVFSNYFSKQDFRKHFRPELREIISHSDSVVVLCDEYIPEFLHLTKLNSRNITAIENGLVIEKKPDSPNEKIIVFIGRLTRWDKRVDRLLKIWSSIQRDFPDWRLDILGDGPERQNLEKLANNLNLKNCHFRGFVNIKEYLPQASILAMTSSSEGFPMVILEAASFGVVPIAYNVSKGISHLIQNRKTGFLIKPFNQNEYISSLKTLMKDTILRADMSENAMKGASAYDIKQISEKWLTLINRLKKEKAVEE